MITDQFIEKLGGTAAVARIFNIANSSVSGWKKTGIPADKLIRLAPIAEQRGIATRKELFPTDWHLIWPELIELDGAPSVQEVANG